MPDANYTVPLPEGTWPTTRIIHNIIKIIISEYMGIPSVLLSSPIIDWQRIADGEIMMNAEIWPQSQNGTVENVGLLGTIGGVGWYVPTWLAKQYPQLTKWQGLLEPDMVNLFKYRGDDLAYDASLKNGTLFAGLQPWNPDEQKQKINNLKLPYTISYAKNYSHWVGRIEKMMDAKKPILSFMFVPIALAAKYSFTRVELPPYTDECYAKRNSGGIDCDYAAEFLIKVANIGLNRASPLTYHVLKSLSMDTHDLTHLDYEATYNEKTDYEAACNWIKKNSKWERWVPPTFYAFEKCPAGRENSKNFVAGADNQGKVTFCASCPAGTFAPTENSRCQPCDTASYSTTIGATSCLACPDNSNTNTPGATSQDQCVCSPGYYRSNINASLECLECPKGASCVGGLEPPKNWAGFWSTSHDSYRFRKCLHAQACPEGVEPDTCGKGYHGYLCGECDTGYYTYGRHCSQCTSTVVSVLYTLLFWAMILAILVALYMTTELDKNRAIERSNIAWRTCLVQTLTYVQLLYLLASGGVGVFASAPFQTSATIASLTNLNLEFFRLQCLIPTTWVVQYQLKNNVLVVLCSALFAFWIAERHDKKYRASLNKALSVALQLFSMGIIVFMSNVLEIFNCYEQPYEPGVYMSEKQPSITCYTSMAWKALLPFAIIGLFFLVICYPLALVWGLYVAPSETKKRNTNFLEAFSRVMRPYKDTTWYWCLVSISRKLLLSSLLSTVAIDRLLDSLIAVGILGLALALQLHFRPYFHPANNTLEALQLGSLFLNALTVVGSGVLGQSSREDSMLNALFFWVFFCSSVLSIGLGYYFTRYELKQFILRDKSISERDPEFRSCRFQLLLCPFLLSYAYLKKQDEQISLKIVRTREVFHRIDLDCGFDQLFSSENLDDWFKSACRDEIVSLKDSLESMEQRFRGREMTSPDADDPTKRTASTRISALDSFRRDFSFNLSTKDRA